MQVSWNQFGRHGLVDACVEHRNYRLKRDTRRLNSLSFARSVAAAARTSALNSRTSIKATQRSSKAIINCSSDAWAWLNCLPYQEYGKHKTSRKQQHRTLRSE